MSLLQAMGKHWQGNRHAIRTFAVLLAGSCHCWLALGDNSCAEAAPARTHGENPFADRFFVGGYTFGTSNVGSDEVVSTDPS